jgi:tRNA(Ile)-lysidine synthetase-like protein
MEVHVKPGKYVLAVSGGVDSVALLDMLAHQPGLELVVAHFEHGIREDSDKDRLLVQAAAERYGLPFVFARGNLGAGAAEATARAARYAFLHQARAEQGADAIITAHHQDDVLETALINMLRGTGSRGLTSLRSGPDVVRPLLFTPKQQLLDYAATHGLRWREDSTNDDERYVRNYLRRQVTPGMAPETRQKMLHYIEIAHKLHAELDRELAPYIVSDQLDRPWFILLPHVVSTEVMALWLRRARLSFDRRSIQRLAVFAKTAASGKLADLDAAHMLRAGKNHITLERRAGLR